MIGPEISLLNSKFLNYHPATKTSSSDFEKFSSSRVVFLKDENKPTEVFHNLCKELLGACVKGPSCLLMGRIPDKMRFTPEDIPGWNKLPEQLHIEGVDNRLKAAKQTVLHFIALETQRID